jgi:hypothetical protein
VALLFGFALSRHFGSTRGRPLTADDYISFVFMGGVVVAAGFAAVTSWLDHRRFGPSRLLLQRLTVIPGDSIIGVLEATERLTCAREVRLELVEHDQTPSGLWGYRESMQVRATVSVPAGAVQVLSGLARVPVSLTVPVDAGPTWSRSRIRWSSLLGARLTTADTAHRWAVRATADLDGERYEVEFPVTVAPAVPEAPYTPRPIIIPPSDRTPKRPS